MLVGALALVVLLVACLVAWRRDEHRLDGQTVSELRDQDGRR